MPVKSYIFGPVKNQKFPAYASEVDTSVYTIFELTQVKDEFYPLIIKMDTKDANTEKKILYTYFAFKKGSKEFTGRFLKQKLQIGGTTWLLDDIYGIASSELNDNSTANAEAKDCAICLTNKIDTVVLPCKHMCLCVECADDLKGRNSQKCPLCRKVVETFLKLQK